MAQNVTVQGASYSDVPALLLPKVGGGSARFDDTSDADATASDMLSGKTAYVNGVKLTGTIASKSSSDITVSGAKVSVPSGYYASSATKSVSGGTAKPPASISATGASVTAGTTTLTLSKSVSVTPTVTAGYISAGTARDVDISLTASVYSRDSSDLHAVGDTVYASSGYYASQASTTVASGTEGTPTATKGTVSNHSVSVTPSVTNTEGYISGGTKTGTAVSVSASELVSGNKAITSNGTGIDVADYSTVSVDVSADPSLRELTVTPTNAVQRFTPNAGTLYESCDVEFYSNSGQAITQSISGFSLQSGVTYEVVGTYSIGTSQGGSNKEYGIVSGSMTVGEDIRSLLQIEYSDKGPASVSYLTEFIFNNTSVYIKKGCTGYIHLVLDFYEKLSTHYDGFSLVTVNAASGGKNAQIGSGVGRTSSTTYTAIGPTITVAKTGTYDVYWTGYRSSTGGTNGSQLYINNSSYGTAQTTFDSTYTNVQNVHLTGVSLTKDQTIAIRARARSSSYYMYVMNLVIIEA